MTKPDYVEQDGGLVFRPPYLQSNTFLTAWIVRSDKAAQQRLLDQAFNRPSGGKLDYRPLLSTALLTFANIERISSLDRVQSDYGYTDEVDTCFWILAGAYENDVLVRLVWFVPYIWVNNSLALIVGRDVFGYPKQIGWSNLPTSPKDAGPLWTDGLVLANYDDKTPVTRQRIFTLSRDPRAHTDSLLEWDAGDMLSAIRRILDMMVDFDDVKFEWHLVADLLKDLLGGHVPIVFLKQFRDSSTSTKACYQAVIEANATVTEFRGAGLLPPGWTLAMHQYRSHRIIDALGLDPRPHTVDHGFWVKFSFSMDLGGEVWRAP